MLKKLLLTFLGALSLQGSDSLEQLRVNREIYCPEIKQALPTAGKVDGSGWEQLPWSGNFIVLDSLWVDAPVRTEVALARDSKYLYLGVKMSEPQGGNLAGRGKFSIWQNDVAEFLLWKKDVKKEWIHLAVDCSGKVYFVKETDIPEMPGRYHSKELPKENLRIGVQLKADGWNLTAGTGSEFLGRREPRQFRTSAAQALQH